MRVSRITAPSFPTRPTTAEAATTLWTQIMFPAAPPTAWRATTHVGSTPIRSPTPNWNSENIMLLTVLLPATNAPSPPMNGANSGHADPASAATPSASAIGIESKPAAPALLLMQTCTIGTVKTRATEARPVAPSDDRHARA